jgi:hypothetical protein
MTDKEKPITKCEYCKQPLDNEFEIIVISRTFQNRFVSIYCQNSCMLKDRIKYQKQAIWDWLKKSEW